MNLLSVANVMQMTLPEGTDGLAARFAATLPTQQWEKWKNFANQVPKLGLAEFFKDKLPTICDSSRAAIRDAILESFFINLVERQTSDNPTYFTMGGGSGSGKTALLKLLLETQPEEEPLKSLAKKIQQAKPIVTNHEPIRRQLIEGLDLGVQAYGEAGKLVDPRLRDFVQHEISCTLTAVLHNALASGYNVAMDWTAASGAIGQLEHLHERASENGKNLQIVMVATTADIGVALQRKAAEYAANNEFQTVQGFLASHQGFAKCFDEIVKELDELYLFDTSREQYELIARKTSKDEQLEILDQKAFAAFKKNVSLNIGVDNMQDIYPAQDRPVGGGMGGTGLVKFR